MTPDAFVSSVVLPLLGGAIVLAASRLVRGPSLPDRVVALDLMASLIIGLSAAYAVATGQSAYLDVSIVLALITFLGTVAFAYFLHRRARGA